MGCTSVQGVSVTILFIVRCGFAFAAESVDSVGFFQQNVIKYLQEPLEMASNNRPKTALGGDQMKDITNGEQQFLTDRKKVEGDPNAEFRKSEIQLENWVSNWTRSEEQLKELWRSFDEKEYMQKELTKKLFLGLKTVHTDGSEQNRIEELMHHSDQLINDKERLLPQIHKLATNTRKIIQQQSIDLQRLKRQNMDLQATSKKIIEEQSMGLQRLKRQNIDLKATTNKIIEKQAMDLQGLQRQNNDVQATTKKTIDEQSMDLKRLKRQNTDLQATNKDLSAQLQTANEQKLATLTSLSRELQIVKQSRELQMQKNTEMQQTFQQTTNQNDELRVERNQLRKKLMQRNAELNVSNSEKNQTADQLNRLKDELFKMKAEKVKNKFSSMLSDLQNVTAGNKNLQQTITQVSAEEQHIGEIFKTPTMN